MRRILVVVTIVTTGLFAVDLPASAASIAHLDREVSGPYTGRQSFDFGAAGCSFVHQVFDATYQADKGRGTFHIDTCVIASFQFLYEGTFTLTTPHRATLEGTVTGSTDAAPTSSLDLTLTVHRGTKQFRHVIGVIVLSGVWSNDDGNLGSGPTSGTIDAQLHRV
jgi:hypothetical protein